MDNKMTRMIKRPLLVDFDLYTDNDPEFKKELIELMIDNLKEMQKSYSAAVASRNGEAFVKTCHKIKVTMEMLQDPELNDVVEKLKTDVSAACAPSLDGLINDIIASLLAEN